jgi:hypothetical protein
VTRWLNRLLCTHADAMRHYQADRLTLRCVCGWESRGWEIGRRTVVVPFRNLRLIRDARRRVA